jgi:hypothetical protein
MTFVNIGYFDGNYLDEGLSFNYTVTTTSSTAPTLDAEFISQFMDRFASTSAKNLNAYKLEAGISITSPKIIGESLSIDSIAALYEDITLQLSTTSQFIISSMLGGVSTTVASIDQNGNGFFAGEITAAKINGLIPGLVDLQSVVSSTIDRVGALEVQAQVFGSSLTSTQEQLLALLSTSSTAASSTLDFAVFAQSSGLQFEHVVRFNGGLQTDIVGSLSGTTTFIGDMVFFGRPYLNADSGGYAIIASGTKEIAVSFESDYLEKPVVQATISLRATSTNEVDLPVHEREDQIFNEDIRYIVSRVNSHGFVIILNKPAPFDIEFDWLALAVKNPKIFSTISEAVSNTEVPVESIAETIPLDVVSSTSQNSSESVSVTSTVDVQPEIQAVPSSVLESVVEPVVVETVQPEGVSSTVSEP